MKKIVLQTGLIIAGMVLCASAQAQPYGDGYGRPYVHAHRWNRSHIETRSVPRHYDPGYGYNSNTLAPWQDRKYQGIDY